MYMDDEEIIIKRNIMGKLKRFILLAWTPTNEKMGQAFRTIIKKNAKEPDCSRCSVKARCPVQEKQLCPIQDLSISESYDLDISEADNYEAIKRKINQSYLLPTITFIFLIDFQNDIGYIYKGDGTIHKIREKGGILSKVLEAYELYLKISLCFSEIRDVRASMPPSFGKN
jgi:hypothetical protein